MPFVAKLDELGSGAWVALMILGFVFWWPVGLALLAFTFWSGRMSCWNGRGMSRWQDKMERMRGRMQRDGADWFGGSTSGNRAFDEYRTETLRRLEDEQREFKDFLQRLRMAKDKAEFDQFMNERRGRSSADVAQPQG
ncbi:DUF2852 domain-containing protein [Rhodoplanes roseus]|uniref:DUF2852 domain-containing protein n=1 Tax=Rhodoplanes roseus TaxID=29409 RepID=A0A327L1R2_9BRAD|nr:DUF2852 domain-containing protein [Rhodoplanes roseus]RAI44391.1 hypothetical protein CH341_09285 [Rhodoplanes roseus]